MKDGSRVRMTIWPLMRAEQPPPTTKVARIAGSSGRPARSRKHAEDQAGERHHRADGKIELAADHQERGGDGEDAELRRRRQDVHDRPRG